MTLARFLLLAVAVSVLINSGHGAISTGPDNVAVAVGSNVTLACTAINSTGLYIVMWTEFATNNTHGRVLSDRDTIHSDHPNKERYSIVKGNSAHDFNLRISGVTFEDGGLYACEDVLTASPNRRRALAQLTVLAENAQCSSTVPSDGSIYPGSPFSSQCSLAYHGNIQPNMTWSDQLNQTFTQSSSANGSHVTSWMAFQADVSQDKNVFSCQVYFTDANVPIGSDRATNVPDYKKEVHRGPALNVLQSTGGDLGPVTTSSAHLSKSLSAVLILIPLIMAVL